MKTMETINYKKAQPEIGNTQKIMNVESVLVEIEIVDDIRYELYRDTNGGTVRVFDIDSGEVVTIVRYQNFLKAKEAYNKAIYKGN